MKATSSPRSISDVKKATSRCSDHARNLGRTQLGFRNEGRWGRERGWGREARERAGGERCGSEEISTESANNYFSFRPLGFLIIKKLDDFLNNLIIVELAYHIRYVNGKHAWFFYVYF